MAFPRARTPETYAQRTYDSPHWIVRFPHRRRYEVTVKAINDARPDVVLDYGAGDGHLLVALLRDHRTDCSMRVLAYEPIAYFRGLLERRARESGLDERIQVVASLDEIAGQQCDFLTCLGVLEHLTVRERFVFYDFARRALTPGGRALIDVPVEIGPALLVKNLGRRILKSDKREYSIGETLRATLGRTVFDPVRWDPHDTTDFIMTHKGFDYRLFARELAGQFSVERRLSTPLPWLPAMLGNQEAFFIVSLTPQGPSIAQPTLSSVLPATSA